MSIQIAQFINYASLNAERDNRDFPFLSLERTQRQPHPYLRSHPGHAKAQQRSDSLPRRSMIYTSSPQEGDYVVFICGSNQKVITRYVSYVCSTYNTYLLINFW